MDHYCCLVPIKLFLIRTQHMLHHCLHPCMPYNTSFLSGVLCKDRPTLATYNFTLGVIPNIERNCIANITGFRRCSRTYLSVAVSLRRKSVSSLYNTTVLQHASDGHRRPMNFSSSDELIISTITCNLSCTNDADRK